MAYLRPFEIQAASQTVAVLATNVSTAITATPRGTRSIRLFNNGNQIVYFSLTAGAATAAVASSTPLAPNSVEVFLLKNDITHVNCIAAGTGNSLIFTVGESA